MSWRTILQAASVQRAWNDAVYMSQGLVVNCYQGEESKEYGTLLRITRPKKKGKPSNTRPSRGPAYRVRVWPKEPINWRKVHEIQNRP